MNTQENHSGGRTTPVHVDKSNKFVFWYFILASATVLLAGCDQPAATQVDYWSAAPNQIQALLTNDVIGYNRTIDLNVLRTGSDPHDWTARVTVEFVNKVGGIERTNLPYYCINTNIWSLDRKTLFDQAMSAASAR